MHAPLEKRALILGALLVLMTPLAPTSAQAQHQRGGSPLRPLPLPEVPGDVRFELLGGSMAPIDAGFTGRLVFFDRVYLSLSLGVGTYGDAARALAAELGASAEGAQLAHDLASGLFSMRAEIGVRPVPGEGLELSVGYALLSHDLRLSADTVSAATGVSTEGLVATSLLLHAIHAEIGWTFRYLDHFLFRPAVGWLHVLDASVALDDTGTEYSDQSLDALADDAAGLAEQWGMSPTFSLTIGYAF